MFLGADSILNKLKSPGVVGGREDAPPHWAAFLVVLEQLPTLCKGLTVCWTGITAAWHICVQTLPNVVYVFLFPRACTPHNKGKTSVLHCLTTKDI